MACHSAKSESDLYFAAFVTIPGNGNVLFNSLNTIVAAVHDDPDQAEATIIDLAALLRYSLDRDSAELVPLGSAGYKTVAVARGEVDAYVHSGGQYQWDSAAPVAIARASGLTTCRLDGSPLIYNDHDPWLPDLIVCRPELADRILDAIVAAA